MKHLKKFNEDFNSIIPKDDNGRFKNLPHVGDKIEKDGNISIFEQDWFEKLLPNELEVVNNGDRFTLLKNDCTINGDLCQFNYWHSAEGDDDVLEHGEPSMLEFDMHFMKNENGIKMIIDITYGDQVISEFSLEAPNKINVIHYNGVNSIYDKNSHWGLSDKSISDLVKFFNSFNHGIKLTNKDLAFIDEHLDSYQHDINNKDHYYTDDSKLMKWGNSLKESQDNQIILVINNSKPPQNKYLPKVLKYLEHRNIPYRVASSSEDVLKFNQEFELIGAISTGSDYSVSKPDSLDELSTSETALKVLDCPIIAFCYGFQSMAKFYGSKVVGARLTDEVTTLDSYDESHFLFNGINLYEQEITFCFHDYPLNVPPGFKQIADIHGKIAGISSDNRYGLLFHPEELEETFIILDNFIKKCKENISTSALRLQNFESFSKKIR